MRRRPVACPRRHLGAGRRSRISPAAWALLASVWLLLSGCAAYESRRGVEVRWQPETVAGFVRGETTRNEVMEALGPPSQVIALDDEQVLYYLFETSRGKGAILILYNWFRIDTQYDRAIFFFDAKDVMRDFSVHVAGDAG
jgi:outer membrane protein assembly factor BamE (lipoprotein component of BamABCDE complex)